MSAPTGESIRLDTNLCTSANNQGPREFHARNGLILPPSKSKLQRRLQELQTYTTSHDMRVNKLKTKIIPFNFTKKIDFIPELTYNNEVLNVTYQTKLLGLVCCSNRKLEDNAKKFACKN